jgi:hypothetical protein
MAAGGGWDGREKENSSFPLTGRLLLLMVKSRVINPVKAMNSCKKQLKM